MAGRVDELEPLGDAEQHGPAVAGDQFQADDQVETPAQMASLRGVDRSALLEENEESP